MADSVSKLVNQDNTAAQNAAQKWLTTVAYNSWQHWANIIVGGYLLGSNSKTGIHRFISKDFKQGMSVIFTIGSSMLSTLLDKSAPNASKELANSINAVSDELKDPNIEGIPIQAESEVLAQDIDINKQVVIVQSSAQKDIYVDNAVPQLRTWQLKGYITATRTDLDALLVIKPSLIAQRALLTYYANARLPVWFKTHDGLFYKVLIKHIDFAYDVRALNALLVNIVLTEYKILESETSPLNTILMSKE